MTSLPTSIPARGSDKDVVQFFDKYFTRTLNYPSNEVDAVVGFFENRGFEKTASIAVSTVLLQQAKIDDIKTFRLLDTLKGLTEVQLSAIVTEILNFNRSKTSTLGYRISDSVSKLEERNIIL